MPPALDRGPPSPRPSPPPLDHDKNPDYDVIETSHEDDFGHGPVPAFDHNGKVTRHFVRSLISFYRSQRRLPINTLYRLLRCARDTFRLESSLVDIALGVNDQLTICGDVHGQFFDMAHIVELCGEPTERNRYLFNGDFVDRGAWSLEVAVVLFAYKLLLPGNFYVARGNHECEETNRVYGFASEVAAKYGTAEDPSAKRLFAAFQEVFDWLPLAHCVNGAVLAMHGGLASKDGVTLEDIRAIVRGRQPDRQGLMCDLLWADPQESVGRGCNSRGFSCAFGPDVTERFLQQNGLLFIVRSHECVHRGYALAHTDTVVTVFSAPNYCDRYGNKGAVCILHGDDVSMPEFKRFDAAPHPKPKVSNAYYEHYSRKTKTAAR